jgi:hypothetical protein
MTGRAIAKSEITGSARAGQARASAALRSAAHRWVFVRLQDKAMIPTTLSGIGSLL